MAVAVPLGEPWSYVQTERFVRDALRGLRFSDNDEAYRVLRGMALGAGFDIAARQSKRSDYGEFRCRKGGRVKGQTTGKCDCPFVIKTSTSPFGDVYIRVDDSLNLEHNHALEPEHYAHLLLPTEIEETVHELRKSGVKPIHIIKFLHARGIMLTSLQVQWMVRKDSVLGFESESEELNAMMGEHDGSTVSFFEATMNGEKHRWGILTFTAEELRNLRLFGDVLFIDGTYCNLKMKWEVLPITAITIDGTICCCGMFYAAMTNETILGWLLFQLWQMKRNDEVKWRTVVTDEDAAFIAAFREFGNWASSNGINHGLHHVLCAFHKERNFDTKLMQCSMSKSERARARQLFKSICYCPHRPYVDHCVEELRLMNEKLEKYIGKEISPLLSNFSRAYLSDVHANGYNTTSPAESMNRLLKHGLSGMPTLADSRRHFIMVLRDHERTSAIKLAKRRRPVLRNGWLPSDVYKFVGRRTADAIVEEFQARMNVELELMDGQLHGEFNLAEIPEQQMARLVFVARSNRNRDLVYQLTVKGCQCALAQFRGIPCCHLLRLYEQLEKPFPRHLVDSRWCHVPDALVDEPDREDDEHDIQEEHLPSKGPNKESPQQRYNVLFGLAKQLAGRASRSQELSERCAGLLRSMLGEMIELPPDRLDEDGKQADETQTKRTVDVVDIVGRPRGRPKSTRLGKH